MTELSRIRELSRKWLNGTITTEEKNEFEEWYNNQPGKEIEWESDSSEEGLKQRLLKALFEKIETEPGKVIAMHSQRGTGFGRVAIAASLLLALGVGCYF